MIIRLIDNTQILITKKQGDSLVENLTRSPKGFVMINEILVNKSSISYIKPGGDPVDIERLEQRQERLAREAKLRVGSSASLGQVVKR